MCTTGMEFASEMVVKAVMFRLKITEVPCKLYPDGRDHPPHLRSIPDGWRHLKFLLIYSPQWLFVYPGLMISLIGLILLVTLYIHPIRIGKIQFEIITMFYGAMALVLGIQILQFAIYTDVYGRKIGQFPSERKLLRDVEHFMQSKGALLGSFLIGVGIIGVAATFYLWLQLDFGPITENNIFRMAILFGTLLILGCEFLTSFFLLMFCK